MPASKLHRIIKLCDDVVVVRGQQRKRLNNNKKAAARRQVQNRGNVFKSEMCDVCLAYRCFSQQRAWKPRICSGACVVAKGGHGNCSGVSHMYARLKHCFS
jgi:hypothetical protein